jgi:DivIVA domain-containing protein
MPDRSTAATEHSLIQEITAPLARLPDDPVPDVADVSFPTALRGYDRIAVDAYVRRASQLVAELQATRSPEAAIRRALSRVGEEVSGILQRAHDTAEQITAQSRIEAEERLEAAQREAEEITAGAHHRVSELDSETDRIWAERHRIVEDVRELANSLLGLTDSAIERFPAATEETQAQKPEAASQPLDRWESDLDKWDEADEHTDETLVARESEDETLVARESEDETLVARDPAVEAAEDDDVEVTRAMPPVVPPPPKGEGDDTEGTRKRH